MAMACEFAQYVERHGAPTRVEVLVCDANGIYRGKWFNGDALEKLMASGTTFPISLLFGDATCETPSALLRPPLGGDPDAIYRYAPGSLRPVPWREQPTAQIQLSLGADDRGGALLDPRALLVDYLERSGFQGQVALEGEFVVDGHVSTLCGPQVYGHEALDEGRGLIDAAYGFAAAQAVPLTSVLPEYGDGQFELNLAHTPAPLKAADDYMAAKRLIKAAAQHQGQSARFMALPSTGGAGNGCHIHISLADAGGANRLADQRALGFAANGLLSTVAECVAVLAPHANSYRRLGMGGAFNAAQTSWGDNHRGAMLRVPKSDPANRRLEFRLAGADVNPYLLTLYSIAALDHGLAMGEPPALEPTAEGEPLKVGSPLPARWHNAIDALDGSAFARRAFGDAFVDLYVRMKRAEEAKFHAAVSDVDKAWASHIV